MLALLAPLLSITLLAPIPHDPDASIRRLSERIAEAPGRADLYTARAALYLRRGTLEPAERDFAWALALGDELPARLGLARVALRSGEHDAALRQARRAVEAAPTAPEPRRVLAAVLDAGGDRRGAAVALEQALSRTPTPRPDDYAALAEAWLATAAGTHHALHALHRGRRAFGDLPALRRPYERLAARLGLPIGARHLPASAPREGLRASPGPLTLPAAAPLADTTLVPAGASWRYLDDGTDQGTAWRMPSFDDSAWNAGIAQLGYGDGDEATVVGFGPNSSNRYITTWFRHTFQVADASPFRSALLRLLRDDGAVVYLNGVEVARSNMPPGAVNHLTLSASTVGGSDEDAFFPIAIDHTRLVTGSNVLAVEIHQRGPTSSDISFDLELIASDGTASLLRGPYLQRGAPTGAVLRWRTSVPTDTVVWLGDDPANLTPAFQNTTPTSEHVVPLSGLLPDTVYHYAIGDSSGVLAGADDEHTFRTHPAPAAGDERPRRIWVIGDSGTANRDARRVRDAYLNLADSRPTDAWLMLGDNAYDSGTDNEYQAAVFDMYPQLLRNTFLWPTLGNHDGYSASSPGESGPYYDNFTLPRNAESGGAPSGTEAYYSFDLGQIHFICLDSYDTDRSSTGAMANWLRADLSASAGAAWRIAFWHHPPYTKGSHDSDDSADSGGRMRDMRQLFLPILDAAGVDLVLSGHSHSYERSVLLDGHHGTSDTLNQSMILNGGDGRPLGSGSYRKVSLGNAAHEGAVYAVAGSSGKISGGALNHPAMRISLNRLGSMVLDIDGDILDARFLDDAGLVRDRFQIFKGPDRSLTRDAAAISVTRGGRQDWRLDLGPARAGQPYIIAGSASGTAPGFTLAGTTIPLNVDFWFGLSLDGAGSSFFPTSTGILDGQGRASAAFVLPASGSTSLPGLHLHHAAAAADGSGGLVASNPVTLSLVR